MVHLLNFLKHVAELLAILAAAGLVIFLLLAVFKGWGKAWSLFKRAWQAWKDLAHKIGNFQARVILTDFLWRAGAALWPGGAAGSAIRCASRNVPEQWLDHPNEAYDMEWARKQ